MSFDSKESVLQVAQCMLDGSIVPKDVQADVMGQLRARLHYGFLAAHCPVCDRIVHIQLRPDQPRIEMELGCATIDSSCKWMGHSNDCRWAEERFQ